MDCDSIAPFYRFCEYLAFGQRLQRHRTRFLERVRGRKQALILGDGDGRFSQALLRRYPNLVFDSIELSEQMRLRAERRTSKRVNSDCQFLSGDARSLPFPRTGYDLIASHFFLDCFSTKDVELLVAKIARHASAGALWMISDFQKPSGFWSGLHAEAWLRIMYLFFGVVAKLEIRSLPDYRDVLTAHGFHLVARHSSMAHFVYSELWQFG